MIFKARCSSCHVIFAFISNNALWSQIPLVATLGNRKPVLWNRRGGDEVTHNTWSCEVTSRAVLGPSSNVHAYTHLGQGGQPVIVGGTCHQRELSMRGYLPNRSRSQQQLTRLRTPRAGRTVTVLSRAFTSTQHRHFLNLLLAYIYIFAVFHSIFLVLNNHSNGGMG